MNEEVVSVKMVFKCFVCQETSIIYVTEEAEPPICSCGSQMWYWIKGNKEQARQAEGGL